MGEQIIVFGDNTYKKVKSKEEDLFFIDRKNTGKNVYFSLQKFMEENNFIDGSVLISFVEKSPLEFRLNYPFVPYSTLVVTSSDYNIDSVEKSKDKDYNIFSGDEIKTENKDPILEQIRDLSEISFYMMDAGYLNSKNNKKIPDWIVTFQDPLLQLFVNTLQPETSNPSMTIEDEYLDNPDFRKMILLGMLRILSNFLINNAYITIEEVSGLGYWTDYEVWKKLREQLKVL